MTIQTLRRLLREYDRRFCSSVKSQFDSVLLGEIDDCNPNALREILEFLRVCQRNGIKELEWYIELIEEHLR